MEIRHQDVDRLEAISRRDEDRRVAGKRRDGAVLARRAFQQAERRGADGDDRPPRARAALRRAPSAAETEPHSACMRWSAVSSAFTGRKVPAPTCSVTKWQRDAALVETAKQLVGEMQAGRRRRDRTLVASHRPSGNRAGPCRRSAACPRCRAAAAIRRDRAIASSRTGPAKAKRRTTSPPSPFSTRPRHRAAPVRRRMLSAGSPKRMRSPMASFLAGRAKARQRSALSRLCSMISTLAAVSSRTRKP